VRFRGRKDPVSKFALFDPDFTDFPNLNRTVGATFADAHSKTSKVVVAERRLQLCSNLYRLQLLPLVRGKDRYELR
jgi:molybdopterin/thiamine biosynthesis adenylyltransferase